jgi:hypothetical protein
MIILVHFFLNASGLVCVENLRKWAEKAFASSTLVFHAQLQQLKILKRSEEEEEGEGDL